jgi:hypothetical protein
MKNWLYGWLHWLLQGFISVDQLLNWAFSIFSHNARVGAWADETLSSRAWRMFDERKPWGLFWRPVIDALFFWQKQEPGVKGHCHGAYLKEIAKRGLPPEMR